MVSRLLWASLLLAGCATSGKQWVQAVEPGVASTGALDREEIAALSESDDRGAWEETRGAVAAPRRETVSLGETFDVPPEPREPAAERDVLVVPMAVPGDTAGWQSPSPGYFWIEPPPDRAPRDRGQNGSTPRASEPGRDQPWPPSYGPPFPFRTAPASPWEPVR